VHRPVSPRGDFRASSKVEDAAVVDVDVHQFRVALVVEAPCEKAAGSIRLADDLDRSNRLLAYGYVDVVHEEVSTGKYVVDVGADDGDPWFTDHVAGGTPPSGDVVESRVGRVVCVAAQVVSRSRV
jgi:hypothetical protein